MKRYFFDIRDGDNLAVDEEGMELRDVEAAQEEAARSLADMTRDRIRSKPRWHVAIEVRDDNGPVVEASFQWRLRTLKRKAASVSFISPARIAGIGTTQCKGNGPGAGRVEAVLGLCQRGRRHG